METVILLEKYSDWLEAYSFLKEYKPAKIKVFFINNDRNDIDSMKGIFTHFSLMETGNVKFYFENSREVTFDRFEQCIFSNDNVGFVIAPFIRYRPLWNLVSSLKRRKIFVVHLSELIPDSFGLIGYRFGYRGKKVSSWLTWPYFYFFALKNKPDVCYFALAKYQKNSFVNETREVFVPPLSKDKKNLLERITSGRKRVLLIGGFGYDILKMATYLNLEEYIATSKNKEIIVDGVVYPLSERICAEEVLLSGLAYKVVSYESTAIVWAKIIDKDIEIECFASKTLSRQYGFMYTYFARQTLSQLSIKIRPECKEMLEG